MSDSLQLQDKGLADYRWSKVTMSAAFRPRDGAGALTFRDRMFLIGCWNPADQEYYSPTCATAAAMTPTGWPSASVALIFSRAAAGKSSANASTSVVTTVLSALTRPAVGEPSDAFSSLERPDCKPFT